MWHGSKHGGLETLITHGLETLITHGWTASIANATHEDEQVAALHALRWSFAHSVFREYAKRGYRSVFEFRPRPAADSFEARVTAACASNTKPLNTARFYKAEALVLVVDMSFGSINRASDLDMSVQVADAGVFDSFCGAFREARNAVIETSASFVFEMQVYADPCTAQMNPLAVAEVARFLCPADDMNATCELLTLVASSYAKGASFDLGAWARGVGWADVVAVAHPNTASLQGRAEEDAYFRDYGAFLHTCFQHPTYRTMTLLNAMKPEGLLLTPSLAASGVYPIDKFKRELQTGSQGAAVRTSLYELLLNMLLHSKSKYVVRMNRLRSRLPSTCSKTSDTVALLPNALEKSMPPGDQRLLAQQIADFIFRDVANGAGCDEAILLDRPKLQEFAKPLLSDASMAQLQKLLRMFND